MREQEELTVIAITTDSQITDGEETTHCEENARETGEATDVDEVTEIPVPSPVAEHSWNKHRCLLRQSAVAPPTAPVRTAATTRPHQPNRRTIPPDRPKEVRYTTVGGNWQKLGPK